jgi:hypothetical protein
MPVTIFFYTYPNITCWIESRGWFGIGQDEYSDTFTCALDEAEQLGKASRNKKLPMML